MPTRTEHIPCPVCGVPRPITVRKHTDRDRATNRPCRKCRRTQPNPNPTIVQVPCVRCGQPRPIRPGNDRKAVTAAETRRCRPCADETMVRVPTHHEPDGLVVEFLIAGTPVKANPAERYAAVAYLSARKLTTKAIADRLHCTTRTVERHRAKLAAA